MTNCIRTHSHQNKPALYDTLNTTHQTHTLTHTRTRSAERFGLEFRDPGRRRELRLEARRERLAGEGFATGLDLFSEEERAKRAARAAKFGLANADPLAYAPDPEDAKRAARGAKFGTGPYRPEAALMDMGERRQ